MKIFNTFKRLTAFPAKKIKMKTLYIIRHAKSSWGDFSLPDFERPLNERGKKDAPEMARRLLDKKINIDAFVSSPAKRAKKTCKLFIKAFDAKEEEMILVEALYNASAEMFFRVIEKMDDKINSIAVFSHNPGITDFVNKLCEEVRIDEMPTCGIFAIEAGIDSWKDFKAFENQFLFFDYPKADL